MAKSKKQAKAKQRRLKARRAQMRQRATQRKAQEANARHRRRLAKQHPCTWPGELAEDGAIFDEQLFNGLSEDAAGEATCVRDALALASQARGEEAVARVSNIPRSSPFAEWRLFIRGLAAWIREDLELATQCWSRLDPERRCGRIATALMVARRDDLETLKLDPTPAEASDPPRQASGEVDWINRLDNELLFAARLVRRIRYDRAAIRLAKVGALQREPSSDLLIGPDKIQWLRQFSADFQETEPELVVALQQAALGRAFDQMYRDLFDEVAKSFPGPIHDRKNTLLAHYYYRGDDPRSPRRRLKKYLEKDLAGNQELSEEVRNALASEIHLLGALTDSDDSSMLFLKRGKEFADGIEKSFQASIEAYPANRFAYDHYIDWLQDRIDDDKLSKRERQRAEENVLQVMENWAAALPDDFEPRHALARHFLERDQCDLARPHVEWLAATRRPEPMLRALPWKLELVEAMNLSRRKTQLGEAARRLESAAKIWPGWLPNDWLAYLQAALLLREGDAESFEEARGRLTTPDTEPLEGLRGHCMMLAAAQRMHCTGAAVRPLRAAVEQRVKRLKQIGADDLAAAGAFFWDLSRVELSYPAYRMHGSKIGKEWIKRIRAKPASWQKRLADETWIGAMHWSGQNSFWPRNDNYSLPHKVYAAASNDPHVAAALIQAELQLKYSGRSRDLALANIEMLEQEAAIQNDSFYRYYFKSLAEQAAELESLEPFVTDFCGNMAAAFNQFADEFGDDDLDLDLDEFESSGFESAGPSRRGGSRSRVDPPGGTPHGPRGSNHAHTDDYEQYDLPF